MALSILLLFFAQSAQANPDAELMLALRGLHERSGQGVDAAVRHVLDSDPDAIAKATGDEHGPVRMAIQYHRPDIVRMLLAAGADPNERTGRRTALQVALDEQQPEILGVLLGAGAAVGPDDVAHAAQYGRVDLVTPLLGRGIELDRGPMDETPLRVAAARGALEVAALLLDSGALPHVEGLRGQALHDASRHGHDAVVGLLLDRGAPIDAASAEGLTALQEAVLRGHRTTVSLLAERGAVVDAFGQVALGRTPSQTNGSLQGETLLHTAARFGRVDQARALLAAGVAVDAAAEYGTTALHVAAGRGEADLGATLLEAGASVASADRSGWTALHFAAAAGGMCGDPVPTAMPAAPDGYTRLVELLLGRDASVEAALSEDLYLGAGHLPVDCARAAGRADLVAALQP